MKKEAGFFQTANRKTRNQNVFEKGTTFQTRTWKKKVKREAETTIVITW